MHKEYFLSSGYQQAGQIHLPRKKAKAHDRGLNRLVRQTLLGIEEEEKLDTNRKGIKPPGLAPEPAASRKTRDTAQRVIISQEKHGAIQYHRQFFQEGEEENRMERRTNAPVV